MTSLPERVGLCALVAVLACIACASSAPPEEVPSAPVALPAGATVYFALLPASVEGGVVREPMVKRMVDSLVVAASGQAELGAAWRTFVRPQDRVGIKVSTSGAPVSSTHAAVVEAVAEGFVAAGVPPGNIVIWDRLDLNMRRAGLDRLSPRFRVLSTDRAGGYDDKEMLIAPVMGRLISGDREFAGKSTEQMSSRSHISSVLASQVDKVVHVPSLTDSVFAGVHGALAGMVLDNVDNWRRLARAPHFGDPFLPEMYADTRIGGKVVLTILDALRPQYGGGPFPGAQFTVNYGALFASRDPVAIDATGLRLIDDFRKDADLPPLSKIIRWLESAELLGLGFASEDKIKTVRTGLEGEVRLNRP